MGTDRTIAYHGACPCGLGTIEVHFCTPDHPWPTKSYSFEQSVSCEVCAARFTFKEQDDQYGLVEKREVTEKEERYVAYKTAQAELLESTPAKDVIVRFTDLMESQGSKAAIHRLLQSHRLVHESYGTFIRRWSGAEAWVQAYVAYHPEALGEFAMAVGFRDDHLLEAVSELARLWADYQRPLTFHGGPLFDISRYR